MGGKFSITLWTVPLRLINLHSVITLTSTLESLLQSRLEGDLSKKLNKKVCSSSNFLLSSKSQAAGCSSCFGENVFKMGPNPDKPARLIIRLLFGFASDLYLDLPYRSTYQFCRFGICWIGDRNNNLCDPYCWSTNLLIAETIFCTAGPWQHGLTLSPFAESGLW